MLKHTLFTLVLASTVTFAPLALAHTNQHQHSQQHWFFKFFSFERKEHSARPAHSVPELSSNASGMGAVVVLAGAAMIVASRRKRTSDV